MKPSFFFPSKKSSLSISQSRSPWHSVPRRPATSNAWPWHGGRRPWRIATEPGMTGMTGTGGRPAAWASENS